MSPASTTRPTAPTPRSSNGTRLPGAFRVSATTTVKYRAYDVAGNAEATNSQLITIDTGPTDTTAPTSTIACNGAACAGTYSAAVTVTLSATDNPGGSGVSQIRYTTDGSTPTQSNGTVYAARSRVSTTTTVKYRAYDVAGNAEATNSQLITIDTGPTDTTAPTSTIKCNAHIVRIELLQRLGHRSRSAATDNPAAPASHRSSTRPTARTPRSRTARVYSGAFTLSATTTVKYRAYDVAGNAEATKSQQIQVDSIAPTSTISCNGNPCGSGWFNGAVSVTLAATDNSGGSGVSQIRYTTDGTTPTATTGNVYTGAFTVSTSGTTVKYRAFDVAGNAETTNSQLLQIDTVAPSSTIRCNGTTCAAGFYSAAVSVTLTATDVGGSGVSQIVYTTDGSDPIAVERHRLRGRVHALLDDHRQVPRLRQRRQRRADQLGADSGGHDAAVDDAELRRLALLG